MTLTPGIQAQPTHAAPLAQRALQAQDKPTLTFDLKDAGGKFFAHMYHVYPTFFQRFSIDSDIEVVGL
eukprot:CAMPEP_0174364144 /NCGR_PEP_ID=MMETSP0811_2-20130205/71730_1 /TAXON_ID=73025 ORGANISM="Eutreptiella gymnastica-like, Strain CCMP1594" /NCGR_SAMPLE_ID=MMETSP0811_2 /ASSEMBLY_ACC=CAM_ASM_000667 /LENGTH=67 /DNA_ID=CAMNT_0015503513 /DNA_START=136 /DNA_END=339 /DNA_ORIENTATION=-